MARALEQRIGATADREVDALLGGVSLSAPEKARAHMIEERLHDQTIDDIWLLRTRLGASVAQDVKQSRVVAFFAAFVGSYVINYSLFIASWWLIGRGALGGQIDWGWLAAWALLFATMLPFGMLATWYGLHVLFLGGQRYHVPEAIAYSVLAAVGIDWVLRRLAGTTSIGET